MSVLASLARPISDILVDAVAHSRDVRCLLVADKSGLPLVSTLSTGAFEEGLAAYAGLILSSSKFADQELGLGGFHAQYVVGRKRHVYVSFLTSEEVLVAVTDATATPTNVLTLLSGLAVQIMNAVADAAYLEPESGSFSIVPYPEMRESS